MKYQRFLVLVGESLMMTGEGRPMKALVNDLNELLSPHLEVGLLHYDHDDYLQIMTDVPDDLQQGVNLMGTLNQLLGADEDVDLFEKGN